MISSQIKIKNSQKLVKSTWMKPSNQTNSECKLQKWDPES